MAKLHHKAKHSDQLVRDARIMHDNGYNYVEIGKALSVNWRTICDWVNYATRYNV